jgi:hypothetical protein
VPWKRRDEGRKPLHQLLRLDCAGQTRDLAILWRRERVEAERSAGVARVDAVEPERVEMEIQVERVAEALHESDGTALAARELPVRPRAAAQRSTLGSLRC